MPIKKLAVLILAGVVIGGCATGVQSQTGSARPVAQVTPAGAPPGHIPEVAAVSGHGLAIGSQVGVQQSAPTPAAVQARPAPSNGCPGIVANMVGCPLPFPSQGILPPPRLGAHIALCLFNQLRSPNPLGQLAVCGTGFLPAEQVTITVTGHWGSVRTVTVTAPDGSFRAALPQSACLIAPMWINARGNRGSTSNTIPIPLAVCHTR